MKQSDKQSLMSLLRLRRDELQSILADQASDPAQRLRRYDEAAIKTIVTIETALITLST